MTEMNKLDYDCKFWEVLMSTRHYYCSQDVFQLTNTNEGGIAANALVLRDRFYSFCGTVFELFRLLLIMRVGWMST